LPRGLSRVVLNPSTDHCREATAACYRTMTFAPTGMRLGRSEEAARLSWSGLRSRTGSGPQAARSSKPILKRQLSLPVSTMSLSWVSRSRSSHA
jgi:hypothetical protein